MTFLSLSQTSEPHHPMLAEACAAIVITVQSMVAAFMLAYVPASRIELMEWTLLPMIGATIAAGGAFCLNTQQEVRRIVVGRCLFAIITGVVGPRLMSMAHPWISEILNDPLLKVGAGFAHGFVGYVLSWWFVKSSYERAAPIAAQLVKMAENKLGEQTPSQTIPNAERKPEESPTTKL